jgi:hypothetical protein
MDDENSELDERVGRLILGSFVSVLIATLIVAIIIVATTAIPAQASTVTPIFGGGTGTSTAPSYGKVLVGDSNGNYELTATSSLGFPVGGSGTLTSFGPTGQTITSGAVGVATTTSSSNGVTSALTIVCSGASCTYTPSQSGTLAIGGGGTGQSSFTSSQLLYGPGTTANGVQSVATSTATCSGTGISCTTFTVVGNLNPSFNIPSNAITAALFAQGGANTVFGNPTGATANGQYFATSTLFTGATGQFGYFSGSGTLIGTSSIFTATNSNIGVGSTTPWALLSVNPTAGQNPFAIGSSTATLFSINAAGGVQLAVTQPATTTTLTLDWSNTPQQIEYRIGTSATTISLVNATTSQYWGSRKLVWVCNPGNTAGALTWTGVEWIGAAPTQTTTAGQCDVYSFDVTHASSSSAFKVAGAASAGFQ